ncbi:hypothetical protein PUN28_005969 [Cardiocondyla obscurior]|uniref:Uncharacterized protein n=1 Tax=Cardiocondyla obscurior TaxID=286306 RepID=A0AAW2G715_9HYME
MDTAFIVSIRHRRSYFRALILPRYHFNSARQARRARRRRRFSVYRLTYRCSFVDKRHSQTERKKKKQTGRDRASTENETMCHARDERNDRWSRQISGAHRRNRTRSTGEDRKKNEREKERVRE